jgi:predicted GTPase
MSSRQKDWEISKGIKKQNMKKLLEKKLDQRRELLHEGKTPSGTTSTIVSSK